MKKTFQKWFPPLLMLAMAAWFCRLICQRRRTMDFAFTEFGRLPVTANGRIVPMDSLARNSLLEFREKQTLNIEPWKDWNENPKIIPATEWLANVMMNPAVADDWPVFRVDNPDLISLLKLPDKDAAKHSDGKHYSWNQIIPAWTPSTRKTTACRKSPPPAAPPTKMPSPRCTSGWSLYAQLKNTVQLADAQDWPAELAAYEKLLPDGIAAVKAQQAGKHLTRPISTPSPPTSRHFNSWPTSSRR
jgi:hypothetical protein